MVFKNLGALIKSDKIIYGHCLGRVCERSTSVNLNEIPGKLAYSYLLNNENMSICCLCRGACSLMSQEAVPGSCCRAVTSPIPVSSSE